MAEGQLRSGRSQSAIEPSGPGRDFLEASAQPMRARRPGGPPRRESGACPALVWWGVRAARQVTRPSLGPECHSLNGHMIGAGAAHPGALNLHGGMRPESSLDAMRQVDNRRFVRKVAGLARAARGSARGEGLSSGHGTTRDLATVHLPSRGIERLHPRTSSQVAPIQGAAPGGPPS